MSQKSEVNIVAIHQPRDRLEKIRKAWVGATATQIVSIDVWMCLKQHRRKRSAINHQRQPRIAAYQPKMDKCDIGKRYQNVGGGKGRAIDNVCIERSLRTIKYYYIYLNSCDTSLNYTMECCPKSSIFTRKIPRHWDDSQ